MIHIKGPKFFTIFNFQFKRESRHSKKEKAARVSRKISQPKNSATRITTYLVVCAALLGVVRCRVRVMLICYRCILNAVAIVHRVLQWFTGRHHGLTERMRIATLPVQWLVHDDVLLCLSYDTASSLDLLPNRKQLELLVIFVPRGLRIVNVVVQVLIGRLQLVYNSKKMGKHMVGVTATCVCLM